MDKKGLRDGRKATVLLHQKFQSDKTVTVVSSVIQQLAHLHQTKYEALHNYVIRAQELSTRFERAGEHHSEPLLKAMVLHSSPERYGYFVQQESFNPASSFAGLWYRLLDYEELRKHRDIPHDVDSHLSKNAGPKHNSSCKNNAAPESTSGQLTRIFCGTKGYNQKWVIKRIKLNVLTLNKIAT